jgi:hypothetical protein
MTQRSLFEPRTLPEAHADAAIAMERVEQAADSDWMEQAYAAVELTCRRLPDWISDDVWRESGLREPREARALGPVLMRARRAGLCVRTSMQRPSIRSHGSGKPVWRSLIFRSGV